MLGRTFTTAAILAATAGLALAQQPSPRPDGTDQGPAGAQMARPKGEEGMRPPPPGMNRMHHKGPRHHRWGPPPPSSGTGFEMRMGRGNFLSVRCGDEPIKACVDAAGPLIYQFSGNGGGGATEPDPAGAAGSSDSDMGVSPPPPPPGTGPADPDDATSPSPSAPQVE